LLIYLFFLLLYTTIQRAAKLAISESIHEDIERKHLLEEGKIASFDEVQDKVVTAEV
jgi:hypothetical protein